MTECNFVVLGKEGEGGMEGGKEGGKEYDCIRECNWLKQPTGSVIHLTYQLKRQ